MVRRTRTANALLNVIGPVELEPGVLLPRGTYRGRMRQGGIDTFQGIVWTDQEFKLEFTGDKLAAMGKSDGARFQSIEYDVSKFVRAGQIQVC